MKSSIRKGMGFGLTSGIITTLGMMVGLSYSTHSSIYVIAGIAIIAITDALSDAIAIHVSEEAGNQETEKNIWIETITTFLSKFVVALLFIIPVAVLPLQSATIFSIIAGLVLIAIISGLVAKVEKKKPGKIIAEHLIIATIVIIATGFIGRYIESIKNSYL